MSSPDTHPSPSHPPPSEMTATEARSHRPKAKIWWSNGIFFISMHLFALWGMVRGSPAMRIDWRTALLCFVSWQLASFGVTIGYHRLWSHRAFQATTPLRIVLAWMGSMGFQGSIKWWVLRHRLHHRFTDSPVHDPYAATKGLFFAHCGWIFLKPNYPRMKLIERGDLEADPVVRFQHRYYIQIALFSGLILPTFIAHFGWGDGLGGLVWGGAVARLLIWHTTFCINSLAHWTGLQPYTEEVTARGNYLLALLTSGEGNHNFHHAFPKDFRNGPHPADWDPTKWIIHLLHTYTPFVPSIARTPESAIRKARARVYLAHAERLTSSLAAGETIRPVAELPVWSKREVKRRNGEWVTGNDGELRRRVLLLLEGCVVDAGEFLEDHPGGEDLILSHAVGPLPPARTRRGSSSEPEPTSPLHDSGYSTLSSPSLSSDETKPGERYDEGEERLRDATRAFFGGMNNHSAAAKDMMRCLRVARVEKGDHNPESPQVCT